MSGFEIYDTDGRQVGRGPASADNDVRELIGKMSKSSFVDAYFDGSTDRLVYKFEAKHRGGQGRGAREQAFYAVLEGENGFDRLAQELNDRFRTNRWQPTSSYGSISRPPPKDARQLASFPAGKDAASDRTEELVGDMLNDGETGLRFGMTSRVAALRAMALYKGTGAVVVVGDDVNRRYFDEPALILEYGAERDFEPLDRSTRNRLTKRDSEWAEKRYTEAIDAVSSNVQSIAGDERQSMASRIDTLRAIRNVMSNPSRTLGTNHPEAAQNLVRTVEQTAEDVGDDRREELLATAQDLIDDQLESLYRDFLEQKADDLSAAVDRHVTDLQPVLKETEPEIKRRLLARTVPEVVPKRHRNVSLWRWEVRVPVPDFYGPDMLVGAAATVLTAALLVAAGLVFLGGVV
jgi:hypothetical protein